MIPAQGIFVVGIARAQNCHLNTTVEDTLKAVHDQIHTLLPGEARNHNQEGTVVSYFEA